jgi:hypothetical protein
MTPTTFLFRFAFLMVALGLCEQAVTESEFWTAAFLWFGVVVWAVMFIESFDYEVVKK